MVCCTWVVGHPSGMTDIKSGGDEPIHEDGEDF